MMRFLAKLSLGLALVLAFASAVEAQGSFGNTTGYVVATCGSPPTAFKAGDPGPFTVDVNGRLCDGGGTSTVNQGTAAAITAGWPVTDGAGTDTVGTLTTSGSGSVIAPIDGYASAKIQVKGTYAAFTVNILASSDGGTTTVPLQCANVSGGVNASSFALAANQTIEISCGHQSGDDTLVVSTSAGPATGTANIVVSPSSFPSVDGSTVAVGVLPSVDPCQSSSIAKSSVPVNITSATTTNLVAVSGTTAVYVCGFSVTISEVITTANTLLFEYGTGASCTGTHALTGLYGAGGITAGAPINVSYAPGHTIFTAPSANAVCAVTVIGATGSFQGVLTYVQQ